MKCLTVLPLLVGLSLAVPIEKQLIRDAANKAEADSVADQGLAAISSPTPINEQEITKLIADQFLERELLPDLFKDVLNREGSTKAATQEEMAQIQEPILATIIAAAIAGGLSGTTSAVFSNLVKGYGHAKEPAKDKGIQTSGNFPIGPLANTPDLQKNTAILQEETAQIQEPLSLAVLGTIIATAITSGAFSGIASGLVNRNNDGQAEEQVHQPIKDLDKLIQNLPTISNTAISQKWNPSEPIIIVHGHSLKGGFKEDVGTQAILPPLKNKLPISSLFNPRFLNTVSSGTSLDQMAAKIQRLFDNKQAKKREQLTTQEAKLQDFEKLCKKMADQMMAKN